MNATIWGVAAVALLSACSLDEGGGVVPGGDASPFDASTDTSQDAPLPTDVTPPDDAPSDGPDDAPTDAPVDAPPDGSTCAATGACTQALPGGWSAVAVPTNPSTACPGGSSATDLLAQVTPVAGACDCGCSVTKSPVCNVGTIQRYISSDASCSTNGVLLAVNGGGCTASSPGAVASHAKGAPIAPSGGTCGGTVVEDKTKVTTTMLRTCNDASCAETVCNGNVPLGFSACVVKTGDQPTCPAGFTAQRTVVGGGFSLGCSACSCDVNGASTCTGAALSYYSDKNCNNLVTTGPVDGVCNANQNAGSNVDHFKYSATLNQTCTASGSKTASPTLTQTTTVCCKS